MTQQVKIPELRLAFPRGNTEKVSASYCLSHQPPSPQLPGYVSSFHKERYRLMPKRTLLRALTLPCLTGLTLFSAHAHAQLVINPVFDTSITSRPDAATIM